MDVFGKRQIVCDAIGKVWFNGKLVPEENAAINVFDRGLQYGYGFFETIPANNGLNYYLNEHMERFNRAWTALFNTVPPDVHCSEIIQQTLAANGLERGISGIKNLATGGTRDKAPYDHNLIVSAWPYIHRLKGKDNQGQHLMIFHEPRQTPLASHKTLNYLYYLLAGRWARDSGGDEAVIFNPDGSISETNTANILVMYGRKLLKTVSPHALPGVMENAVCRYLQQKGYKICEKIFDRKIFFPQTVFCLPILLWELCRLSL